MSRLTVDVNRLIILGEMFNITLKLTDKELALPTRPKIRVYAVVGKCKT